MAETLAATPDRPAATAAGRPLMVAGAVRWLRDPLLVFLLAGGAIFAAHHLLTRGDPVRYTPAIAAGLASNAEVLAGRPPTAAERARLRENWIADELLFRKAIADGEHLTDSITRKRLIDKMRYATVGNPAEPGEADMVNWYADHIADYRTGPLLSFEQVFRSAKPATPAEDLLRLRQGVRIAGDDFWMGRTFPRYDEAVVRSLFGEDMLNGVRAAPANQWIGPLKSPRGWHYVRRSESLAPQQLPYAQVREQVRRDMLMAQAKAALDSEIARLAEEYGVVDGR